jgi:hypothetical protein
VYFASAIFKHKNLLRIVVKLTTALYTGEGGGLPYEVQYKKDDSTQTLWNANNVKGYCEEKAKAFVEKQKGWGWSCKA